jgi:hypothetical protein
MAQNLINTRADLDAIAGTQAHSDFMSYLAGTMTRKQNTQTYPAGYGTPEYTGETLEPIWEDVEDLSTIESFGFVKGDFI